MFRRVGGVSALLPASPLPRVHSPEFSFVRRTLRNRSQGLRSNMPPILVSPVRKPRKRKGRFVTPVMIKVFKEVKKSQNTMRTISIANQAHCPQRARQNVSKIRNIEQSKTIGMSQKLGPLVKGVGKSDHSLAMPKHMDQALTLKVDNCLIPTTKNDMRNASEKMDRNATSRPMGISNVVLKPLEPSRQTRMKQGPVHVSHGIKRSSSQANHLKAMPGLVHNMKGRSNLDQGQSKQMHNEGVQERCTGGTNIGEFDMRCEPLLDEKPEILPPVDHMAKRRRKYIETNDDIDDSSDQVQDSAKDDTLKDCHAKVSTSFVPNCVVQQCYCCSKPIDESAWRGIFKIDMKEYISLAGHLSTKAGEKVWNLSKSLRKLVEVTKVCRSDVWPKRWEASGPTSDNIGLYFFPYNLRPDKYMDQLVKEVMENDLALKAAIDGAEMLIFPSSVLPEPYKTFQTKHYLWGVFRPKEVGRKHGDDSRNADHTTEEATAAVATNATTSAPAGVPLAATNVVAAMATEAPAMPTQAHTVPTNHSRIDSSMGATPGRVVSFVVRQTPRAEQLIQEMEREGALIFAMKGEMMAGAASFGEQHGNSDVVSRGRA